MGLEFLFSLLDSEGVTRLVMESRFPAADARDAAHFRALRKRGYVSTLELHFADPAREHRLWVPDQILGAWGEAAAGAAHASWDAEWGRIGGNVTVVDVPM